MSLEDVTAVQRLVNLYAFAVDSQNWDLFDRIFTPDMRAEYNESDAPWTDLATFKKDFEAWHAPFDATQHTMCNFLCEVNGDTANSIVYAFWRHIRKGTVGGDTWNGQGWYEDVSVRTGDGWRIKHRKARTMWWGGNILVMDADPNVKFDLPNMSIRGEAAAGRITYLKALNNSTG